MTTTTALARIVVADDDERVLQSLAALLRDAGYDVVATATDGPSAVDAIVESRADLAIVDFRMPDMSGVEVAEAFRRAFARVPVIVFSAYDDAGIQAAARAAGVRAYLVKGCPADEIFAAIEAALGPRWAVDAGSGTT
jgi:two-component system response regulator PrrA